MTTEYPAPAEPEPYSFADAVALIVATAADEKLPFPRGLRDNIPGDQLLVLDFADETEIRAWTDVFGLAGELFNGLVMYGRKWHGWTVACWSNHRTPGQVASAVETPPLDQAAVAAAILTPDAEEPTLGGWRIARETAGGHEVSTIELRGSRFETKLFGETAFTYDENVWRYATRAEAEAGHAAIVQALRDGIDPNLVMAS